MLWKPEIILKLRKDIKFENTSLCVILTKNGTIEEDILKFGKN